MIGFFKRYLLQKTNNHGGFINSVTVAKGVVGLDPSVTKQKQFKAFVTVKRQEKGSITILKLSVFRTRDADGSLSSFRLTVAVAMSRVTTNTIATKLLSPPPPTNRVLIEEKVAGAPEAMVVVTVLTVVSGDHPTSRKNPFNRKRM